MAKSKAAIVMYARIDGLGWRRGSVIISRNGKPKLGFMLVNGEEHPVETSLYQIRTYSSGKATYTTVAPRADGTPATYEDAVELLNKFRASRQREDADQKLGIIKPEKVDEPAKEQPLETIMAEYIAKKKSPSLDLSETAIRHYEDALTGFLTVSKRQFLSHVTEDDVREFMDYLKREGYSQKTRVDRYVTLRGFLRKSGVNVDKLIDESFHARWSEKPEGDTTEYSQEQLDRLFAVCDEYHANVFQFLLASGLRFRECSHLTWADIDFQRWVINVPKERKTNRKYRDRASGKTVAKTVSFKPKSRKGREVPIFPSIRPMLLAWRAKHRGTEFVFGSKRSDMPDNHWWSYLKTAWRRAGLNCNTCESCCSKSKSCEEAFLHRFRHSFAHRCLDNKIGIHKVCRWMGHHSIEVTQVYLRGASVEADCDPFAPVPAKANVVSIAAA